MILSRMFLTEDQNFKLKYYTYWLNEYMIKHTCSNNGNERADKERHKTCLGCKCEEAINLYESIDMTIFDECYGECHTRDNAVCTACECVGNSYQKAWFELFEFIKEKERLISQVMLSSSIVEILAFMAYKENKILNPIKWDVKEHKYLPTD